MWRPHALAAALFAALAAAMTWPLAANLGSAVAWPGDPFINIWILDWDWWATFHQPLSLFQANAFYPARLPLAYSENLYGIAVVLFPFRALGVPPIAAYNVAMLLGYAFSGFGAHVLGRYVTGSWWAGVAAGIFYAFVPFRITHAAHVQHVWAGWLPILIVALLHYKKQPTWPRALLFGFAFLFNGLSNIHWLLFGSVAIFLTFLIVRPRVLPLAVCTLAAGLLLAPFLIPYATVAREYNMRRTWQETKSFSAAPRDWLVAAESMRWYGALKDADVNPERWLFPGVVGIVFSIVGLARWRWWRSSLAPLAGRGWREAPGEGRHPHSLAIALLWLLLGIVGSLGTHLFFHRFLFTYVPGFQAIRVPARWANIAYVGMAMLIAHGVKRVAPLAAAAFAVELCAAPILWYLAVPSTPPVYRWIRDAKPHAVLELPIGEGLDYGYLLRATAHHRPVANAAGFTPPETRRIESLVNTDALVPELQRIGVDRVVVHGDAAGDATRRWLARELARGNIAFVKRFDGGISGDWLFSTDRRERLSSTELDAFLAGRATYNDHPFGFVDFPQPGQRIAGRAYFSGYAFSPYGIRSVTLRLQNGRGRIAPFLFDDPALRRRFPWYDATTKPRFQLEVERRPDGVGERTDLQVDIVDGRGRRVLLEDRFFLWPDRR
ncbi:MAG TPA: hypothetical protein VEO74_14015 [Thermoanaerobaculia bacterium]|nr:hypothetical protein [Thermoanaerobaculia bacterium]